MAFDFRSLLGQGPSSATGEGTTTGGNPPLGMGLLSGLFSGMPGLGALGGILPLVYLFSQMFGGDGGGGKKEPAAPTPTAAAPGGTQPGAAPAPMQAAPAPQPTQQVAQPAWQQYSAPAGPGTPAAQQAAALQNQPGFFGQIAQALQDPGTIAMLGNLGGQLAPQGPMAGAGQYAAGVAQNKSQWDYQLDTLSKLFGGQSPF